VPEQSPPNLTTRERLRSAGRLVLRVARWTLIAVVCAGLALYAAGNRLYAHPQLDPLRQADAILVLGGPGWDRYPFAIDLAGQGWAPNLVISTPIGEKDTGLWDYCQRPGERPFRVHCLIPDPVTTRGEARGFRRLAQANQWDSVIVVTWRPHISRARFIMEKCFSGRLTMVESPYELSTGDWIGQYLYQTGGFLKAALSPGC
jgi:uncharacterized SAM-binding protein YcdF (DUF218 family)